MVLEEKWILCPICSNKTRLKIREDTILENFPLYCPNCGCSSDFLKAKVYLLFLHESC